LEVLLLILLLAVAAVILLPDILKERTLQSPLNTVSDFHRGMHALAASTHTAARGIGGETDHAGYYYSVYGDNPEPYVRRSQYSDSHDDPYADDFVPYPRSRARSEMIARRNRIIASLVTVALATGILILIPKLRWLIPLHVVVLIITAGYIFLVILKPQFDGRR
jgi:hypothetical protein